MTLPLLPTLEVPVLKPNAPLTPLLPALAERMRIAPLVLAVPAPLRTVMAPPVAMLLSPAVILTPPPTPLLPRPTVMLM